MTTKGEARGSLSFDAEGGVSGLTIRNFMSPYRESCCPFEDEDDEEPVIVYLHVNDRRRLNLRQWPAVDATIMKVLDFNERVELLETTAADKAIYGSNFCFDLFVKVRAWFPTGPVEGWAARQFLTEEKEKVKP